MRHIHVLLIVATAAMIVPLSYGENFSSQHEMVQKLFQSNEEKTAKDSAWTARDIFKLGVISDGSRRDGYAEYVCQVLYDYGFKGKKVWVQVIDIVELIRNSDWVKLGEAHCQ